jgi:hypothetical protein
MNLNRPKHSRPLFDSEKPEVSEISECSLPLVTDCFFICYGLENGTRIAFSTCKDEGRLPNPSTKKEQE